MCGESKSTGRVNGSPFNTPNISSGTPFPWEREPRISPRPYVPEGVGGSDWRINGTLPPLPYGSREPGYQNPFSKKETPVEAKESDFAKLEREVALLKPVIGKLNPLELTALVAILGKNITDAWAGAIAETLIDSIDQIENPFALMLVGIKAQEFVNSSGEGHADAFADLAAIISAVWFKEKGNEKDGEFLKALGAWRKG